MVNVCSAYGCRNRSTFERCQRLKIAFHRFPRKNPHLLKLWLRNMRRRNFVPNEFSRICSEHFTDDDFILENFTNRKLLKRDSVPTVFAFSKPTEKRLRTKYLDIDRDFKEEEVVDTSNHSTSADVASSSVPETQGMNSSAKDRQRNVYIVRCNPESGVVPKRTESDGTESLLPSSIGSAQEQSHQLCFESIFARKRKECEDYHEVTERRHREKMQKWDRFLNVMEELVETCKL